MFCKECGKEISEKSIICPKCRVKIKQETCNDKSIGVLLFMGILFAPYIFGWITLKKGYSLKARIISLSWIPLIFLIISNQPPPKEYSKAEKEQMRIEKIREKEINKKENRKKIIGKQFSSWDGSHRKLNLYIRKHMNDPKSYRHAETKYWDRGGDYIIVETTYRGKNAFGGIVKNSIKVKASIDDGEILYVYKK